MNRKKIYKIIIKLITGLCLVVYFTASGVIGFKPLNAFAKNNNTSCSTIEYKIDNKVINKDTNTSKTKNNTLTQYGEKNMLTGKVGGELAPHAWFLNRLNNLARDKEQKLNIFSGYRSYELQQQLFDNSDGSGKMVAHAGQSRHQAGLAVDVDSKWATELTNEQLAPYGLYKPMSYENWHIEPVETKGKSTQQMITCYGIPAEAKDKSVNKEVNIFKDLIEMEIEFDKNIIKQIIKK